MTEHDIQNSIRIALSRNGIYTERSNAGKFWGGKVIAHDGKRVVIENPTQIVGAVAGTSDLIGFRSLQVTQDMVGKTIAQFIAIEVKKPGERPRENQIAYLNMVNKRGGVGIWVDNVDKVEGIFK